MKKIFVSLILTLLLVAPCQALSEFGFDFDTLKKPAVILVAGASSIVVGSFAYLFGSRSSDAKRIEQERLLARDKDEREKQERREIAEKFILMMKKKYQTECAVLSSGNKLTSEQLAGVAAERFNHKTPFVHLEYSRQLKEDLIQFSEYYYEFSPANRWSADELEECLNKISTTHSLLFKNVILSELEKEKTALAEERKRKINEKIDREKLKQEILKRESFEDIRRENEALAKQRSEALAAVKKEASEHMKTMANYAAAIHANNLNGYSLLLQDLRAEFTKNGLTSLANKIATLEKQMNQLNKNVAEDTRETKKVAEIFEIHRNQLNQIKNEVNLLRNESKLSKEQLDRINKIVERIDSTTAVTSSDVGDIKNGNNAGVAFAPIKENHWQ